MKTFITIFLLAAFAKSFVPEDQMIKMIEAKTGLRADYFTKNDCPGYNSQEYMSEFTISFDRVPKAGQKAYVTGRATVVKNFFVSAGRAIIKYNGIKLLDYTLNWNHFYEGGQVYEETEYLPSKYGMPGVYAVKVWIIDNNGQDIMCFDCSLKLARK
jgi:hypothetical protein